MNPAVRAFFDAQADAYQRKSRRWPWGWLRRRESAALLDLLGDVRGLEVLELGAGAGYYARRLLAGGARHVVAVDLSPRMVAALPGEGVTGIAADAAQVDLGRRFARILIAGLLEFVDDPGAVLANASRHAEAAGVMVVLAPRPNPWGRLYRAYHRKHGLEIALFPLDRLRGLAVESGWRVTGERAVWPFTVLFRMQAAP